MSEPEVRDTLKGVQRILIVDDDVELAAGLTRALESQGYLVRAVDSGARAIVVVPTFLPDLILLDVMMPNMDGWEVLRRIRASDTAGRVAIIMLTASDSETSKVRGFGMGADDYLTKPFSVNELRCRIAAVLRRTAPVAERTVGMIPVVARGSIVELLRHTDVYYVEGIRNYTYVHTADARFLSRLTLGAIERMGIDGLMRVHRSYVVNLNHVGQCGWTAKSTYKLRLADVARTELPVSRSLVSEVKRALGLTH